MNEEDFEDVVKLALTGYAKENDLPLLVETVQEKGFNEGAGLVVRLGGSGSQVHTIAIRRLPSRTYQDGPKEHTVNRYATQKGTGFTMNSSVLSALSAKDYITETGVLTE